MFNCKKIEDTRSGKRRRRRRREEREANMAAVQSFTVAMLWRKAMVRSEEQFFFFSVQRHQSLFFSPPRLFCLLLSFFFFFFFFFMLLFPFSVLSCFSSLSFLLYFSLVLFSLWCPSSPPPLTAWWGGIYRGRGSRSYPTPIQSWGQGRMARAASI